MRITQFHKLIDITKILFDRFKNAAYTNSTFVIMIFFLNAFQQRWAMQLSPQLAFTGTQGQC